MHNRNQRGKYVIPVGYVFRPEPEELLGFLVESIKLKDQWVQPPEIRNIHLYDKDSNPWTLLDGSSDKPCYKKGRVGVGTWKEQKSSDVAFRCEDGMKLKGLKRYFSFVPEKGSGYSREEHGHWIMNEYSLLQDGLQDYVICEIHKKPSSKRKLLVHDDDDDDALQNKFLMKKMRSFTTTCATSDDHVGGDGVVTVVAPNIARKLLDFLMEDDIVTSTPSHQEVGMKTESSTNICEEDDDDDDRELVDLLESQVEGVDDIVACDSDHSVDPVRIVEEEMNDIVACGSLAPAPVEPNHDHQGMISIRSVDSLEHHDHHYPSSSLGDRDSIVMTDTRVPSLPDFPNVFWDFPTTDRPVHMQERTTSTSGHHDYLGSLIVDGSDDGVLWGGLGFNEDSAPLDFDFIEGLWS